MMLQKRQQRLQLLSIVCFCAALALIGFLLWFTIRSPKPPPATTDQEAYYLSAQTAQASKLSDKAILAAAISFIVMILTGAFKYNLSLSNFWYSRIIALTLYESEAEIGLHELVASFSTERIELSIPTKAIAELMQGSSDKQKKQESEDDESEG
ncbi:MAG: hypothetical protein ABJB97_04055 [Acidobacteriota bacterium]